VVYGVAHKVEQGVCDPFGERAVEAPAFARDLELDALACGARHRTARARGAHQRPAQGNHAQPYQSLLKLEEASADAARALLKLGVRARPASEVEHADDISEQRVRLRDEVVQLFERHAHGPCRRAR
jgi:hypothetical protein